MNADAWPSSTAGDEGLSGTDSIKLILPGHYWIIVIIFRLIDVYFLV